MATFGESCATCDPARSARPTELLRCESMESRPPHALFSLYPLAPRKVGLRRLNKRHNKNPNMTTQAKPRDPTTIPAMSPLLSFVEDDVPERSELPVLVGWGAEEDVGGKHETSDPETTAN